MMKRNQIYFLMITLGFATGCRIFVPAKSVAETGSQAAAASTDSPLPAAALLTVKSALPKVAYKKLQEILLSSETVWYDHDSMKPSYQASIQQSPPYGANANDKWFDLIADSVKPVARNFYDEGAKRWRFPFGTTAGTDQSTNMTVFNFLSLPSKGGKLLPLAVYEKPKVVPGSGFTLNSWGWIYPVGTVIGEVLFVSAAPGQLLPSEIRIRQRYSSGWAVNVFRPFPTASSLSLAIKQKRPTWETNAQLKALVAQLEDSNSLKSFHLSAPQLPGVFDQEGALDELPEFADEPLVRELLTQTLFVSAYQETWKQSNGHKSYAPSTLSKASIVPDHYQGGMFEVSEASCMRCHQEAGRPLTAFSPAFSPIVLYGEMWGRDGIFSFHPFDESEYSVFWREGTNDNRRLNTKLKSQGILAEFNATVHGAPDYPAAEVATTAAVTSGQGSGSTTGNGGANTGGGEPSNLVIFRIKAGTGSGEWNEKSSPVLARAGQTIRIINDDDTGHVLHTNGQPCPHGDTSRKVAKGEHYDCSLAAGTPSGTEYLLWDHFLGGPNSARFWIKVQ